MVVSFNSVLFLWSFDCVFLQFLFVEKGIVYVDDDIESDEEEKCVYTLDDICNGHDISVCTDPQKIRFEIFSTRIDEQSNRVVSIFDNNIFYFFISTVFIRLWSSMYPSSKVKHEYFPHQSHVSSADNVQSCYQSSLSA